MVNRSIPNWLLGGPPDLLVAQPRASSSKTFLRKDERLVRMNRYEKHIAVNSSQVIKLLIHHNATRIIPVDFLKTLEVSLHGEHDNLEESSDNISDMVITPTSGSLVHHETSSVAFRRRATRTIFLGKASGNLRALRRLLHWCFAVPTTVELNKLKGVNAAASMCFF